MLNSGTLEVEIISTEIIDGGIQVFARAWLDGSQVGFGKDGTVDVERFRFFNPPVLINDISGDIVRESVNETTGDTTVRKLREDPAEALNKILVDTIKNVGGGGQDIVPNKVGNTTSTFYPDASVESTSVDGRLLMTSTNTFSSLRSSTTADTVGDADTAQTAWILRTTTGSSYSRFGRSIFVFDTASLPDTDTIDSATLSLNIDAPNSVDQIGLTANESNTHIVSSAPASDTALVAGDYDSLGSVDFGSFTFASIADDTYSDVSLNAAGIANIDATGASYFGAIGGFDLDNDSTTYTASSTTQMFVFLADNTGTTQDPKLVVEHSAAASTSLKSINGLAQASMKEFDGLALASIKSINGLSNVS